MSDKPLTDITFDSFDLHPLLLAGLEAAGFTRCTPIQALTLPLAQCPPLMPLPLPRAAKSLYDRLRQVSEAIAVKHQVPAEVLLRKKWLDALVLGYVDDGESAVLPSALKGWRHDILTVPLLEVLDDESASVVNWRRYRHREDS